MANSGANPANTWIHRFKWRERGNTPSISSISPVEKREGDPDFVLTVYGANFTEDSVVYWRGLPQKTQHISDTEFRAQIA